MKDLKFMKDYRDNTLVRNSFNELAGYIFGGINFENWYKAGYWTDKYNPYSLLDGDKIVANVSVNEIDLVIDGQEKRAIQIGTVMTHPDYRNKGLSREIMNRVLSDYENKHDLMYLFANHSVLDFYPKFDFKPVTEYQYSMKFNLSLRNNASIHKFDSQNIDDLHFIYQFVSERLPVSMKFGSKNTRELFMFYCLNVFTNDLYYIKDENVIVIYQIKEDVLHIFDIVSKEKFDIVNVLQAIANEQTQKIVFHYMPDYKGLNYEIVEFHDDTVFFVRYTSDMTLPTFSKHPVTSQA
ncbi:GNAT family N-acetyltransferase [Bacillus sp. RG28]|uniref:GNAT family N-acetyltransferase n=1 Tax=Gottfriedia endophytica TaxID=2820819 RepID=A0A940SKW5_9BACI|nr:GNAT family N-acetyltransferase [Gottfriedia endophytica]MBP0726439.1 GNAT family N-acetyltransferase [Gottfriedia endophytica]